MRPKSLLAAIATFAFAIIAPHSHAGFISGDIEVNGTFSKLPDVGTSSIVSGLGFINVDHSATIDFATATGWFTSLLPNAVALANNINLDPSQPIHFAYKVGDFTFLATRVSNVTRSTPSCSVSTCTDELAFDITGVVSAPGFSTTAFSGKWTGFGSCAAHDGTCTSNVTGHWSAYLDPPVGAAAVPEPGTLILLGLALSIFGLVIRRRQT